MFQVSESIYNNLRLGMLYAGGIRQEVSMSVFNSADTLIVGKARNGTINKVKIDIDSVILAMSEYLVIDLPL